MWWVGQRVMILTMRGPRKVHRTGTIRSISQLHGEVGVKVDKLSGRLSFAPRELFPLEIRPGHLEP